MLASMPSRLLLTAILLGALVGLVPFAYANVSDPLWIGGIYDAGDYDDVAAAVTSADTAPASVPPTDVFLSLVRVILSAGAPHPAAAPLPAFRIRGPPIR